MKIIRNGKEYELTSDELTECYHEERMNRDIADVKFILTKKKKQWPELLQKMNEDEEFAKRFAQCYRSYLNMGTPDGESEWGCLMAVHQYYEGQK